MTTMKEHVEVFDDLMESDDFRQLQQYVSKLSICKPSPVFHIASRTDIVNPEVRKSHTLVMDDPAVLSLVKETILKQFQHRQSVKESDLVVHLARDHVTFIRYDEGGFFDWHIDYEKYKINQSRKWLECHLLLCITAPTAGGDLEIDQSGEIVSVSMLENRCIVFDKSMEHRGSTVITGNKVIMTVDVLVSNTTTLEYPCASLDLVDCLVNQTSFISMACESTCEAIKTLSEVAILYIQMNDGEYTLIFDCNGLYYKKPGSWTSDDWYRTEDPNPGTTPVNWDRDDLADELAEWIGDVEDVLRSDLDSVKFSKAHKPIPYGTKFGHMQFKIIDNDEKSPGKLKFTTHCNEFAYNSMSIVQGMGILYMPDKIIVHTSLKH